MAIKRMCDQCGVELDGSAATHGNHGSTESGQSEGLVKEHGDIRVRLVAGKKGNAYFSGDWCKYCMLDTIAKLDDRPKPAEALIVDALQRQIDEQVDRINRLNDVNEVLQRRLAALDHLATQAKGTP